MYLEPLKKFIIRKNPQIWDYCRAMRNPSRILTESNKRRRIAELKKLRVNNDGLSGKTGVGSLIVSLTSYSTRINTVDMAIRSIMDQTVKPDKVILYLDSNCNMKELPKKLIELQEFGLEIKTGYKDLKPHKKYFFAFKEYPDACIVTIDDDCVYPRDTIESLYCSWRSFPKAVSARRVHRISFANMQTPTSYNEWGYEWVETQPLPRKSLLATGCGGVLYPPHIFNLSDFKSDIIEQLALTCDDLWLKAVEAKQGICVVYAANDQNLPYLIAGTQEIGLAQDNVGGRANDLVFEKLLEYFDLDISDFSD